MMRTFGSKTTGPRGVGSHFGALRRLGTVVLVSVLSSTVTACYQYTEIPVAQPVEAERVELHLNDEGRVQLRRELGPGARTVEGRVVTQTANAFSIAVYRMTNINGDAFTWSGEEVLVPASSVESMTRRDFDRGRSAIAVASLAGGAVVFALSRSLIGGGRTSGDPDIPPVQTVR